MSLVGEVLDFASDYNLTSIKKLIVKYDILAVTNISANTWQVQTAVPLDAFVVAGQWIYISAGMNAGHYKIDSVTAPDLIQFTSETASAAAGFGQVTVYNVNDSRLISAIESGKRHLENIIGFPLSGSTSKQYLHDGTGQEELFFNIRGGIRSIDKIEIIQGLYSFYTIDPLSALLVNERGMVRVRTIQQVASGQIRAFWPSGRNNLRFTLTIGFAENEYPSDLKDCVIYASMIQLLIGQQGTHAGLGGFSIDGYSESYTSPGYSAAIQTLKAMMNGKLGNYRTGMVGS